MRSGYRIAILLAAAGCWLPGCGSRKETAAPRAPVSAGPLPADLVLCIDNSSSIQPREQVLIRELVMLLADLADVNDRLSVVTFGDGARVAVSMRIASDSDREAFKREVRSRVDFREKLSDIRAGLATVASQAGAVFRTGQAKHTVAVLSDGKLEPSGDTVEVALEELRRTLSSAVLARADVFAIALGEDERPVPGLPSGGIGLMRDYVARVADRFFQASSLDGLLPIVVQVANRASGTGMIAESGAAGFRIDNSVEALTLVVRKRSVGGAVLFKSGDLRLAPPLGEPLGVHNFASSAAGAVRWNTEYEYFDLIQVRKPAEGLWRVALAGGGVPQVSARITTPVELECEIPARVFANEAAPLRAWIYQRWEKAVMREPFDVQAQISADPRGAALFVPLHRDESSGRYSLELPRELPPVLPGGTGRIRLQVIARRWKIAGRQMDDWFLRVSPEQTIEVVLPFVTWTDPPPGITRIPLLARNLRFGALVDRRAPGYPAFDAPPLLRFRLERFDGKSGGWTERENRVAMPAVRGGSIAFEWASPVRDAGAYRYRYELEGTTRTGLVTVRSPSRVVQVRTGWEYLAGVLLALLGILTVGLSRAARLNGQAVQEEPDEDYAADAIRAVKQYSSESLNALSGGGLGTSHAFRLTPRRLLFWKHVRLEMVRGQAVLEPGGTQVAPGKPCRLKPWNGHRLTFHRDDGTRVTVGLKVGVVGN